MAAGSPSPDPATAGPAARELVPALLARCRFPAAGTAVTCAVSGGADSLALLALAVHAGCLVTAVHVDHGIRAGSAAEAEVVRAAAARFGAGFRAEAVSVSPGPNLEARARVARYRALPDDVCTGHTADDLAETVVLNLVRGAGLDGLAAMARGASARETGRGPCRPLLALRRAETAALCRALGLDPVADPMNADPAYRRVRVRAEVLPLLGDLAARDVVPVLARQAALLADEAALLDALAGELDAADTRVLRAAPVALARRAVRRWLAASGYGVDDEEEVHPPSAAVVERVLAVASGSARAADLTAGWRVTRSAGRLYVHPPAACAAVTPPAGRVPR